MTLVQWCNGFLTFLHAGVLYKGIRMVRLVANLAEDSPSSIMPELKIFVVFGATGNQSGSVIESILSDPKTASEFKIRGVTRDPSKPNARASTAKGVECVAADVAKVGHFHHSCVDRY